MQDAAFKTVFCHPAPIEGLVRGYVVILLEFQGTHDQLMALRMAVYQLLTVQQLLRRQRALRPHHSLEVLSFVIHHGEGRWQAATRLRKLFPRWVPGDYKVISRGTAGFRGDLAQTILQLERDRSVEGTLAVLAELRRIADETGSDYGHLMAECVGEMLVLTKRITRAQLREVRTMAQVDTAYQRSLEEFGQKWFRQGRDEGQAAMLDELVREKFGPEAAQQVCRLVEQILGSQQMSVAVRAVLDSTTPDEFLARMQGL